MDLNVFDVLQRAVDAVDDELSAGSTGWQWGDDTPQGHLSG